MSKNVIREEILKHYKPEVRDERLAKLSDMLLNTTVEFIYQLSNYVTERQLTLIEKQSHDALKLIVSSENTTSIKISHLGENFTFSLRLSKKSKFYIQITRDCPVLCTLGVNTVVIKNIENISSYALQEKIINFAYCCAIEL
ncbi:hypothetical protein ACVWU4_001042 [Campylobacter coli]